ncbi:hypothetical protein ACUSIJ_02720 [Pseudochelatococcus sp. B33]
MKRPDATNIDKLLLLSTNFDTLHRSLPDTLFPGKTPEEQKQAREKQLDVITAWRESLVIEEDRILGEEP